MSFLFMPLIRLALGWGFPTWASKLFGYVVPILGALAVLWGAWSLFSGHYESKGAAKVETKVRVATVKATEQQIAVNRAPAIKSRTIAEESDDKADEDYAAGRAAGIAYANAHRVRPQAVCPTSNADLPGTNRAAQVDDRSGAAPGMVALSQADFDTLTENSTRLAKVHQDAAALIAAGVAVPMRPAILSTPVELRAEDKD
ncbi:MAG: hypothetical protein C0517_12365 [Erythrobacter sp.]|nr:hypothetical protein [Erythrobacter sp.]